MNKATKEIAKLFGIDAVLAVSVQNRMGENGLDFSECTQREFDAAAREAYNEIIARGLGKGRSKS